ncbi:MAG TPA: RNA polymerase sigma-70 factor [Chitinophaga sp.]|uniref:RNA polymerase sigma-70 factor n=1 Tax=Chitinophaga sp. TaxID=1869181 RepID=UPI002B5FC43D|nr:RNA polymerase sigma-70 factor [Chitinophaga sp.]HVI46493.1 RNA polymerase sigma-70 factor [Chitinophaga sp.]
MSTKVLSQVTFEYLFTEYYEVLCQMSFTIVKNNDAAKDIVQDFFVKYWEKYTLEPQPDNFPAYAYVAVKNRSLNYLASEQVKHRHAPGIEVLLYNEEQLPPSHSNDEHYREKLMKAINQLPAQRRRIFTMSAVEGFKYAEISALMNISVNTVKTHIRKAYLAVRKSCGSLLLLLI